MPQTPAPARPAEEPVCALRVTACCSRETLTVPTRFARVGGDLVILAEPVDGRIWWQELVQPHPVRVRLDGVWHDAVGRTVLAGRRGHATAVRAYRDRVPDVPPRPAEPVVVVTLLPTDPAEPVADPARR